jgi:hypothetical protein
MSWKEEFMNWIWEEELNLEALKEVEPELASILAERVAGRYMVYPPKNKPEPFVIQRHEIGESVSDRTPIIVRDKKGRIRVIPIRELFTYTERVNERLSRKEINDLETWTVSGWSKIKYVFRHSIVGKLKRIRVPEGIIEVTEDHSLFRNNESLKVSELKEGERIDLLELPEIRGALNVDKDWAWLMGFYLAEGSAHRGYLLLTNKDLGLLEKARIILGKYGYKASLSINNDAWNLESNLKLPEDWFTVSAVHEHEERVSRWKTVPSFVFSWNEVSQNAFLEGYLDGDGICISKGHIEFGSTSQALIQGLLLIIKRLYPERTFTITTQGDLIRVRVVKPEHNRFSIDRNIVKGIETAVQRDARGKRNSNYKHGRLVRKSPFVEPLFTYSDRRYVYDLETESHDFLAGVGKIRAHNSQHFDMRFKVNGYLVGWSIVGFSKDNPATVELLLQNVGKGFRAETKASQPLVWINVEGEVKAGEVGAGVEKAGKFTILTGTKRYREARAVFGAQKEWFHEYFLKDGHYFKDWTRVIFRAVRVQRLDPTSKRPTGKTETFWRFMIPKNQIPYALERGMKEGWKPPAGIIPFPLDWAKKNFAKEVAEWEEYMKGKKEEEKKLSTASFCISEFSYMGPRHIRGMKRREWHLLIDDGGTSVMDFRSDEHPLYVSPISMTYEGRINKKWLSYEGKLKPQELWNPNKELEGDVEVLTEGELGLTKEKKDGKEALWLHIPKGVMKGNWLLLQEEQESPFYTFTKEFVISLAGEAFFVFDRHEIEGVSHWDLRIRLKIEDKWEDFLWEFSGMDERLDEKGVEEPVEAIHKRCNDLEWMNPDFKEGKRKVGGIWTTVERIDQGNATFYNATDEFWSFNLDGEVLNGYFIAKKEDGMWKVMRSRLPSPQLAKEGTGDPSTGDWYKPFKVEQKQGWDYFILSIYDERAFTRAEPEEMVKEYLSNLKLPAGVDVRIGLYPVAGTLHHARVMNVKFPDTWTVDEATAWIKKNRLERWGQKRIVKREE